MSEDNPSLEPNVQRQTSTERKPLADVADGVAHPPGVGNGGPKRDTGPENFRGQCKPAPQRAYFAKRKGRGVEGEAMVLGDAMEKNFP